MLKKVLSKDKLLDLYKNQSLSDKEIGSLYGVTDVAISKLRRKYQIDTMRQFDRLRLNNIDKPNVELLSNDQFFDDYTRLTHYVLTSAN